VAQSSSLSARSPRCQPERWSSATRGTRPSASPSVIPALLRAAVELIAHGCQARRRVVDPVRHSAGPSASPVLYRLPVLY
jgi:hypothetical protein